ncbi:hypothetical protein Tco_0361853, partial [Tanacetum coccineum]
EMKVAVVFQRRLSRGDGDGDDDETKVMKDVMGMTMVVDS